MIAPAPSLAGPANSAVQSLLDELVGQGSEIGVQVAAYRGPKLIVDAWAGIADPATRRPVDGTTLFNVFSVSKAVTAVAVHIQAERGLIDYDAPLARYWPEFSGEGRERVTVRHVLIHRSGMALMPPGVTVEQMCDWGTMIHRFEQMVPEFEPGTRSGYQAISFGWLLGEVVRRTDPMHRDFGTFVRDEIARPLGIEDLWLGVPDADMPRVAKLDDHAIHIAPADSPYRLITPYNLDLRNEPFGRPEVQQACIPATGGVFTARATARFFALLANGGELDGVRLLSPERVASLSEPRPDYDEIDAHSLRTMPLGLGGLQLGGSASMAAYAPRNLRALCFPGVGGSIGIADPDSGIAMGFCHNRMSDFVGNEDDTLARVLRTIERAVGVAAR